MSAGDGALNPIPDTPTHCRGRRCQVELEPLRRYAGLCKRCVARRMRPAAAPTRVLESRFRVVRRFTRKRPDGKVERYLEVKCLGVRGKCGRRRTVKASTWQHHRPRCCSACTLREIDACGFEPERLR